MKPITIYTKDNCPYCDRAKAFFTSKGWPFTAINFEHKPEEFTALKNRTGLMTVPQIFFGEKLIGGYTDMMAIERDGHLDTLLQDKTR
ncbi:MAG: glutaredoxin 3 [Bdellovibrionales bacterium]|nr:glutaredoxin 3 [Bdellovibrionales bacterium]